MESPKCLSNFPDLGRAGTATIGGVSIRIALHIPANVKTNIAFHGSPPGRAHGASPLRPTKPADTLQQNRSDSIAVIATVFSSSPLDVRPWSLMKVTVEIPDAVQPLKRY